MPQLNKVVLTDGTTPEDFNPVGNKDGLVTLTNGISQAYLQSKLTCKSARTMSGHRVTTKLVIPVTDPADSKAIVDEEIIEISFKLSSYSTEAERSARRNKALSALADNSLFAEAVDKMAGIY